MKKDQLTGIVLCGGKSSRMGADKGLLSYKNNTLIQSAIESIERYCSDILLSTNNEAYGTFGYKLVEDRYKNIGPLGGLSPPSHQSCTAHNEIPRSKANEVVHSKIILHPFWGVFFILNKYFF